MITIKTCLELLLVATALTKAAPVHTAKPFKLDFDIVKTSRKASSPGIQSKEADISKQDNALERLENIYSMYMTEVQIGSPPQTIKVSLDTGSSDLWVPLKASETSFGTFNSNDSSTYSKFKNNFEIRYGDRSSASGVWANDTVTLNNVPVENFTFGYAQSLTAQSGVFGIGLKSNEASAFVLRSLERGDLMLTEEQLEARGLDGFYYDNFPVRLKKEGYIYKAAYSLYLAKKNSQKGSILFGAIDFAKFDGDLKMLDLVKIDDSGLLVDEPVGFYVSLDEISIGDSSSTSNINFVSSYSQNNATSNNKTVTSYPALLDSGTTLIYAPHEIASQLQEKYAKNTDAYNNPILPCNTDAPDFKFRFGDKTIVVPFHELLFQTSPGSEECIFGVADSQKDYFILGDAFLRSAYIYYDLEAHQVGIAQAKYNDESRLQVVQ